MSDPFEDEVTVPDHLFYAAGDAPAWRLTAREPVGAPGPRWSARGTGDYPILRDLDDALPFARGLPLPAPSLASEATATEIVALPRAPALRRWTSRLVSLLTS